MSTMQPRIEREQRTVTALIRIHCHGRHHAGPELCAGCTDLQRYVAERMARCVLHDAKPTCATCKARCFAPPQQVRFRAILRYAGPQLFWRQPLLALWHHFDTRHTPPR